MFPVRIAMERTFMWVCVEVNPSSLATGGMKKMGLNETRRCFRGLFRGDDSLAWFFMLYMQWQGTRNILPGLHWKIILISLMGNM